MAEAARSLSRLLAQRARRSFLGREAELALLRSHLIEGDTLVVFVHGIPGLGKSTLLANFACHAEGEGVRVLALDCRTVEPTEQGFLAELGRQTGEIVESLEDAREILGRAGGRLVLAADHYETFGLMDTWLRSRFLPAMPEGVRMVVAGRRPPVSRWRTSPGWSDLVHELPLGPLDRAASEALLEAHGLEGDAVASLVAATHGNPLALTLAASAARIHGPMAIRQDELQDVMQELAGIFLEDVDDPAAREALKCASVARRVTRSLLRAFSLDDSELYDTLRGLPFVDARRDGLSLHDAVREAVAQTLKATDPQRFHACRCRAWRQLREEARAAARDDLWRYTADMLYLATNPVVREAFFPSDHRDCAVEAAGPEDADAIRVIALAHDGPEGAAALDVWWRYCPDAFKVVRDREDQVVGFYCMSEVADVPDGILRGDPVAAAWFDHFDDHPPVPAGSCLFLRRWLSEASGDAPSAEQAASWLDVKRAYMELRPGLRRVYLAVADLAPHAEVATELGFLPLPDLPVELGGRTFHSAHLDFGPESVDGWITGLVGAELGVGTGGLLDHERRCLCLDGEEVALTPLEYGLAAYLQELEGATATRDAILENVWDQGAEVVGSNVVDAVVKSLRRKLGAESGRIETVRGFGYRWKAGEA